MPWLFVNFSWLRRRDDPWIVTSSTRRTRTASRGDPGSPTRVRETVGLSLRHPAVFATDDNGWGGRIRTCESRDQNPMPYRLATPQWNRSSGFDRTSPLTRTGAYSLFPSHPCQFSDTASRSRSASGQPSPSAVPARSTRAPAPPALSGGAEPGIHAIGCRGGPSAAPDRGAWFSVSVPTRRGREPRRHRYGIVVALAPVTPKRAAASAGRAASRSGHRSPRTRAARARPTTAPAAPRP